MFRFLRVQCLLGAITEEQLEGIVDIYITKQEHDELVSILHKRK